MKKLNILLTLLVAIALVIPASSWAKSDVDERIQALEQQVEELKTEVKEEKQSAIGTKYPLDFYGFVAAQFFYGTHKTQLYGGINSSAAQSRVANKAVFGTDNAWFSATPQNSRIGLKWTGTQVGTNTWMGGVFEMDFVNILNSTTYGTSPMPRIRLLSMSIWGDRWLVLAGQNWDIFSPLNTRSLSLGNNVWFQGNMGFRRPQLRFEYKALKGDVNNFKIAASIDNPGNTDDLWNGGVDSGYPYGELLLQYNRKMKYGDFIIAASGAAGTDRRNGASYRKVYGFAGSLNIPFHKFFKLSGEIHYGQNMGNFLTYAGTTTDAKNLAGWGQISSEWCKWFETNVGFGIDDGQTSKIAAGNVDRNQIIFANVKFKPWKPFYVGLQYENLRTRYVTNGTSGASVIFTNLVYSF